MRGSSLEGQHRHELLTMAPNRVFILYHRGAGKRCKLRPKNGSTVVTG